MVYSREIIWDGNTSKELRLPSSVKTVIFEATGTGTATLKVRLDKDGGLKEIFMVDLLTANVSSKITNNNMWSASVEGFYSVTLTGVSGFTSIKATLV